MFSTICEHSSLDIIQRRLRIFGVTALALAVMLWPGAGPLRAAEANTGAVTPPTNPETFFNPAGRRQNPTGDDVEWRRQAGRAELDDWQDELLLREIEPLLERYFAAIQGRGFSDDLVESLFAPNFEGSDIAGLSSGSYEGPGIRLHRWRLSEQPQLDRAAFAADLQARYRQFRLILRTEHYVDRFEPLDNRNAASLYVPFRVTGYRDDDHYEDQGYAIVDVARDSVDRHWQIARIDIESIDTLRSSALFRQEALVRESKPMDQPQTAFVDYFAEGVSVVDIDGDGDLDIFAAARLGHPWVFVNDGEGRFQESAKALGFGIVGGARSGYFFDWDNDGDQDALVLTATRMVLLQQQDGVFEDISPASRFDYMTTTGLTSAAIADFDNDGLLDFYVTNYGDPLRGPFMDYFDSNRGFKNQLFRNEGEGRFRMTTREAGLDGDNARWSFSALAFDYDRDGNTDLYVVNDYGPNQLFRNRGDLTFEDVTTSTGATDFGNGMAVSLGDLTGDGHEDLYVSNMISHAGKRIASGRDFPGDDAARDRMQRFAKGNTLLVADEQSFREIAAPVLADAKWAWGNTLFDYDNDGDLDVYVTNGMYSNLSRKDTDPVFWRHLLAPISAGQAPGEYASGYFAYLIQQESFSFAGHERNRLFQNAGDSGFYDVAPVTGADLVYDSRSVVAGDLDADGDLDLVVASRNDPKLVILWNTVSTGASHLDVRLIGTRSNRDGVGAVVEVECSGKTQRRTRLAGSGYLSQEPHSLWFGLGRCTQAERVSVRWPSGAESVLEDIPAGESVEIREP